MKRAILNSILCLLCVFAQAQQEFHVTIKGTSSGNGTLNNPWDLQTALSQKPEVVNGDDTIWLHKGIYTGRFVSAIQSTKENKYITVAPFNQEKVILNGNVTSKNEAVLTVRGKQVIFRDFEITWLGDYSRNENDKEFQVSAGISHTSGQDCRFYNLIIHNNPGLGIGSWKHTGGSIIENCMIYFNGFVAKDGKGRGEGIYVQNISDKTRLIKNNIIFSNYYKGIEVWSAGRNANSQFVKNINLENNIIFNSGFPSGNSYDNVIVATDDRNGINIAHDIKILNNVFYHNTDYLNNEVNGNAPSLTLGFYKKTPVENIIVKDNIILGRNNVLRLLYVNSMTLTGNTIYGGYVIVNDNNMQNAKNWTVDNNSYFTKNGTPFNIDKDKKRNFKDWQTTFNLDKHSQWKNTKQFDLKPVLSITENTQKPKEFNLALFNKQGKDVEVDFTSYNIPKGTAYKIYDAENRKEVAVAGSLNEDMKVTFPMNFTAYEKPSHNTKTLKTESNFGVFIIEFNVKTPSQEEILNPIQKFLKWLGL